MPCPDQALIRLVVDDLAAAEAGLAFGWQVSLISKSAYFRLVEWNIGWEKSAVRFTSYRNAIKEP
jgi:hypothetical protein